MYRFCACPLRDRLWSFPALIQLKRRISFLVFSTRLTRWSAVGVLRVCLSLGGLESREDMLKDDCGLKSREDMLKNP